MRIVGSITTKVGVGDLITKLRANRSKHEEQHVIAMKAWRKKVSEVADASVKMADEGSLKKLPKDWNKVMDIPITYLKEYDNAILMLEASTDQELELTQEQFNCLYLDQWGWKDEWLYTNQSYTG